MSFVELIPFVMPLGGRLYSAPLVTELMPATELVDSMEVLLVLS